ncbi:hypothetical protein C8F04DRAFT_1180424 [Mycena alexandri]|uniref:Uncharacterized protein n=1 Tax=Mycena alexandri TaxID=1745969 RepID=A0AAD6X733_9AGAR|nr:hypothetical protein C8F04DRAFT_1180424 [Mycena alexandri]
MVNIHRKTSMRGKALRRTLRDIELTRKRRAHKNPTWAEYGAAPAGYENMVQVRSACSNLSRGRHAQEHRFREILRGESTGHRWYTWRVFSVDKSREKRKPSSQAKRRRESFSAGYKFQRVNSRAVAGMGGLLDAA